MEVASSGADEGVLFHLSPPVLLGGSLVVIAAPAIINRATA
jgi:hypothetical protein